jgi:curved DNA-binding protein CbpA
MKSAYLTLGLPGNAAQEDIEEALKKATAHYSHAHLAEHPQDLARLQEIREAYKILSSAEMRAAHDRKLANTVKAVAPPPRIVIEEATPPWYSKPLNVMVLVMFSLFAIGGYMNYSRNQVQKAKLAQEQMEQKAAAENAARAAAEEAQNNAEKARQQAEHVAQEQRLRIESNMAMRNAAYADAAQQAAFNRQLDSERREAQRKEAEIRSQERQNAQEAQRRLAADQQRIRELCYQQYRKTQC